MKEFIYKNLLLALIIGMIFMPCYFIDPFNVFHPMKIHLTAVSKNANYIKNFYIVHNPEKYNEFIFGSSRCGYYHSEKISDRCYNMTYSMGQTQETLLNLNTFIANNVKIDKIYLFVDSYTYTTPRNHFIDPMRCPYEYSISNPVEFYKLYLNPLMVCQSLGEVLKKPTNMYNINHFFTTGVTDDYGIKTEFDYDHFEDYYGGRNGDIDGCINEIKEIIKLCKEHNIELTISTNPMHEHTYTMSAEYGYFEFLKKLSEITDFYNFSSLSDVTKNYDNYYEASHFKSEVGDLVLDRILNNKISDVLYKQGFGWFITKENIDELIELLKKQLETH